MPTLTEILDHHIAIQREKNSPLVMDLERVKEALVEKDEALKVISPERLCLLATWIDLKEANNPDAGVEVQLDLRKLARMSKKALSL